MKHLPHFHGLFHSDIAGRTDKLNISVPHDSYIIPADIVSGVGQGNTMAGGKKLDEMFKYNHSQQGKMAFASGGMVPIIVAGGEYHVHPSVVKRLGKGNMDSGHKVLDHFVKEVRKKTAKTLDNLPPPKGSDE